jgi:hypothetical protein
MLTPCSTSHLADDYLAGVDADARGQIRSVLLLKAMAQLLQLSQNY